MTTEHTDTAGRGAAATNVAAAFLLFLFGLLPLANWLTHGAALPWYRHASIFWITVGGGLLVMLSLLSRSEGFARLASRVMTAAGSIPWNVFVGACALLALVVTAWLAMWCFARTPHNADEVAQLFHAKILLTGRLTLPVDPNAEFFQMDHVISGTRWYSQFPPGGPAVLALGELVHAAWLVNPLLIALSVLTTALFARRVFGEHAGRAAALLFTLSPFALFMGASFMNHVPTMFFVSVAMWQLAVWSEASSTREAHQSAALVGLSIGVAFTIRPLDALAAAGVIGLMQLSMLRGSRVRVQSLVSLLVGGLIPSLAFLLVNARTNGSPTTLGYEVLYGSSHQLGFHMDPYGTLHTPMRALLFASKYLLQLNVLLMEWPLPAVGVVIAGLVALRRPTRWDLFLVGMLLAQVVCYAFYWHDGSFRGPRFLFTALPAIVILLARAPVIVAERTHGVARRVALLTVPACVLFAWLAYGINDSIPGRIRQYRSASLVTRVRADSVAAAGDLHNALVFINEGQEARNLHQLWTLGLSRGDAARLMVSASACAVRQAIDAEEAVQPPDKTGRRDRLIRSALSVDPRAPEPPACIEDARLDDRGTASYVPFFAANELDAEGRIAGNVVFVLDQGARNELLRPRFGARRWYRYGAYASGDTIPRLRPY